MVKEIEKIGSKITPRRTFAAIGTLAIFGLPAAYAAGAYTESAHQQELAASARKAENYHKAQQWETEASDLKQSAESVVTIMRGVTYGGATIVFVAAGVLGSVQYRRSHANVMPSQEHPIAEAGPTEQPSTEEMYDALAGNQARLIQAV